MLEILKFITPKNRSKIDGGSSMPTEVVNALKNQMPETRGAKNS